MYILNIELYGIYFLTERNKGLKSLKLLQLYFVRFSFGEWRRRETMELIVLSGRLQNFVAWGGALACNASGNLSCAPRTAS
jgi:hypothetical protein